MVTEPKGQVLAGTITFDGDKLEHTITKGYEILMNDILEDSVYSKQKGGQVFAKDDPHTWFKNLPMQYSGSYLRAGISG